MTEPSSRVQRPTTRETLNHDEPSVPRQAACVILLRDGDGGIDVLLVRRNPAQRFMGGFWVFPGGAVDAGEGDGEDAHRAAAVRELEEEAGVPAITPDELVKYSRWITPALIKTRFDTHFFLARAPVGVQARVDGRECIDLRWISPRRALNDYAAGDLQLVFPTVAHLEQLAGFGCVEKLLDHARNSEVRPVRPRVLLSGEIARVVLPGEPGYEELSLG